MEDEKVAEVLFILGIMPRSGTHFLANLLCQHPDCETSIIPEDGLLTGAGFLSQYANCVFKQWETPQGITAKKGRTILLESVGEGLTTYLHRMRKEVSRNKTEQERSAKYLVTKTPLVIHLDKFHTIFPHSRPLILVRDGRDLVESNSISFGHNWEDDVRKWVRSAQQIRAFVNVTPLDKYLLIKYEELHIHTEQEMRRILAFFELDATVYDFQKALNIPVVGSSVFKRGEGKVHWVPVQKTDEFDPLSRASHWTRSQHERFNWIAKSELQYFGYKPREFSGYKLFWDLWNRFQDVWYGGITWQQRFRRLFSKIGDKMRG